MADREKIIKGLKLCVVTGDFCGECPYDDEMELCIDKLHDDALALLKEQEPKPVGKEWNECPNCGKVLSSIEHIHFCGMCGQAVKWDE